MSKRSMGHDERAAVQENFIPVMQMRCSAVQCSADEGASTDTSSADSRDCDDRMIGIT